MLESANVFECQTAFETGYIKSTVTEQQQHGVFHYLVS
jgi:hypothetical protein